MCDPTSRHAAHIRGTERHRAHVTLHMHALLHACTHTSSHSGFFTFSKLKKKKKFAEADGSSMCMCQPLEILRVWQYHLLFPSPLSGLEPFPMNVPYSLDYTGISIKETKVMVMARSSHTIPLQCPCCQEVVIKRFPFHTQTRKRTFILAGFVLPG